jgi:hypothetical protein
VQALHNREAAAPRHALLAAAGDGYAADLALGRAGVWELRFEVRRGDQRFTSVVRREVAWP